MTLSQIHTCLHRKKHELGVFYYLGLIQLAGGLRISEVLNIKAHHIINGDTVFVKGLKGSSDKRIFVPECSEFLSRCSSNNINPFNGISRFQVYRLWKRLGFVVLKGNGKRNAVTHSVRKLAIQELHNVTNDINSTASAIGHKSSNSTKYYVKRKGFNN